MAAAYMRRKEHEATVQAVAIWGLLGKAMAGDGDTKGKQGSMSAAALVSTVGVEV